MRVSMERRTTTVVKLEKQNTYILQGQLKSVNSDTVIENSHKINAVVRTGWMYPCYTRIKERSSKETENET